MNKIKFLKLFFRKFANSHHEREGRHHSNNLINNIPLQKMAQQRIFENTIEAQVQQGDSLQAIALRFHCSVRINTSLSTVTSN